MSPQDLASARVVEVTDERDALAHRAIALIQDAIWDVHPARYLLAEIQETRRGTARGGGYHLLAAVDPDDEETPVAAASGAYLQAANAGFVSYLAVREAWRGRGLGRRLRAQLVEAFRAQARRESGAELACVLGEVERDSAWLRTLVAEGRTLVLDVPYFHPWMPRHAEGRYALYREQVADARAELPAAEVAQLIEAIWRRAYHVDEPRQRETFRYMLRALEGRATVGPDPAFAQAERA